MSETAKESHLAALAVQLEDEALETCMAINATQSETVTVIYTVLLNIYIKLGWPQIDVEQNSKAMAEYMSEQVAAVELKNTPPSGNA